MDDKVFEPEVITESPYPNEVTSPLSQSEATGTKDTISPTTTKENRFPVKRSSFELLSTALNTRSRNILQEFALQQSGGLKIGDYQDGITGDIRLTPNGITARDNAGLTTFALDGTTGNAIFAGEIRAGSLVTGTVEITDGNIAMYNDGILEIFIGDDGT